MKPDLLTDTSVSVPLVVTGHEAHDAVTRAVLGQNLGLAGHAWFETFSVLTRLPPPARRGPSEVHALLEHNFPATRFLDHKMHRALIELLSSRGIAGGSVYDALVGYTALAHDVPLLTRDRRALLTYLALGVAVRTV